MMTQKTIATFQTERDIGLNRVGVDKLVAVENWEGTGDRLFVLKNLYNINIDTTIKEAYINGNFLEITLFDTSGTAGGSGSATSGVTSVNTMTGDVVLGSNNISGLENVNNTADLDKPISTLTQDALDLKVNTTDIIDNLTSTDSTKPLSSNQGLVLDTKINTKDDKKLNIINTSGTVILDDTFKNSFINCTASTNITIPANLFNIGDDFVFFRDTVDDITIIPDTGVTLKSKNDFRKIKSKYSSMVLIKTGINEFSLIGDIG